MLQAISKKINRAFTIACYTLHESIHNNVFVFALVTLIITLAAGYLFTEFMFASRLKVLLDFSLLAYQLFVFGLLFFFIIPFLGNNERRATMTLFLTKNIDRTTLLSGIFLGFVIILVSVAFLFFSLDLLFFYYLSGRWLFHLSIALGTIMVEGLFLVAVALFFSLLLSPILTCTCVIALYIIGYMSNDWLMMVSSKSGQHTASFLQLAAYVVPDLSALDIKSLIIYQVPFSVYTLIITLLYTLSITGIFFIGALFIFNKKAL